MAVAQAKLAAVEARTEGLSFAANGWLGQARSRALVRLQAMGLPGRRDEYWRYTEPTTLHGARGAAGRAVRSG